MFALTRRRPAPSPAPQAPAREGPERAGDGLARMMSEQASRMGREAAEVRGTIEDTHKAARAQSGALQALAGQVREVNRAQARIAHQVQAGQQAVARAGDAVRAVGEEVGGIVDSLRQVGGAAGDITQIALQTRLVAFNASVEAKRAGEAGRGFGVVADAVKDLAGKVEASSKQIMSTVGQLDQRIAALAREIRSRQGEGSDAGAVHRALAEVTAAVASIHEAAGQSSQLADELDRRMGSLESEVGATVGWLDNALGRTETFLGVSEQMIEAVADSGTETEDTPYIRAAQQAASRVAGLLEDALRTRALSEAELFDERYQPIAGTDPQHFMTAFVPLAERLFPQVQEPMLELSDKVVFCIAVDRNGFIPCHNHLYSQPQRPGDVAWNTAHSRGRRIFDDRTGLASARNRRPFLLQTYRRDMGGGKFVVMKEAAAPITVAGRHWGGLRLAFKF
jgi:methyl-accepting chemotaxis protein